MRLALHPKLKRYLIITAKHAVNSILVNTALITQWHSIFNFDNWPGVWAVTRLTLSVIGAREAMIWVPKILKWSQTDVDPDAPLQDALAHAADANKEVKQAIDEAKTAAKAIDQPAKGQ